MFDNPHKWLEIHPVGLGVKNYDFFCLTIKEGRTEVIGHYSFG